MKKTLIALIAALACMTSCSINIDLDAYTQGGADITNGPVSNLDILWGTGAVQIRYWNENYISFFEEEFGTRPISEPMCYYFDGKNLRIRDTRRGLSSNAKKLVLYVPSGITLQRVDIETGSADIDVDLDCTNLDIETDYGGIYYTTENRRMSSIDIENENGETEIYFPVDIYGFKCTFESDGRLISDFGPLDLSPSMGWYIYGTGGTSIDFESFNRDLKIYVNKGK